MGYKTRFSFTKGVHGSSRSGLCPTRDQPDRIGLRKSWSAADQRGSRIGVVSFAPETRLVRSEPSTVKNPVKIVNFRQKKCQIRQRSNRIWWDLARSGEISLDLDEISLDLLDKSPKYENLLPESENLKLESENLRPEFGKSRQILEIFAGNS